MPRDMAQGSDPWRLRPPRRIEKQVRLQPVVGDLDEIDLAALLRPRQRRINIGLATDLDLVLPHRRDPLDLRTPSEQAQIVVIPAAIAISINSEGWWCAQSGANRSQLISLLYREFAGKSCFLTRFCRPFPMRNGRILRASPLNSLDPEQGIAIARTGKRAPGIREFQEGEQRTIEMREMQLSARRRLSVVAHFGVKQDGRPAVLLNEKLLAEDFDAARAVLAQPCVGLAFFHFGKMTRL